MTEFADDPARFFHNRAWEGHHITPQDLRALQLEALRERFATYRDAIPPLTALADAQNIRDIATLDDVAPLLFSHSFYKSYPAHLLWTKDFRKLTHWLSRLTTNDLSVCFDDQHDTVDGWINSLETKTNLHLNHSSGTTGEISFFPRGRVQTAALDNTVRMSFFEMQDEGRHDAAAAPPMPLIWPTFARGHTAMLRSGEVFVRCMARSPANFYPLHDYGMSCDVVLHVIRAEQVQRGAPGGLPEPSAYLSKRLAELDRIQQGTAQAMDDLLDTVGDELRGKTVLLAGGTHTLLNLAQAGLARGMENLFAPNSIVGTFGGTKGIAYPGEWKQILTRFTGVQRPVDCYGMTELLGGFLQCDAGRYHVQPWVIPFVFHAVSGARLPRAGVQHGRAAYFDLTAQTYWGGIVSGDRVEISYQPCRCGRTSPHLSDVIDRMAAPGSDDFYNGPALREAVDAARGVLAAGLG